jgi:hypothetical protein
MVGFRAVLSRCGLYRQRRDTDTLVTAAQSGPTEGDIDERGEQTRLRNGEDQRSEVPAPMAALMKVRYGSGDICARHQVSAASRASRMRSSSECRRA